MELILDHHYDFTKPVYLLHPSSKFWEVKIDGPTLTFRVGKIRETVQSAEEKVEKEYPSVAAAKVTAIKKITEKLTKGYVGRDSIKNNAPKAEKKVETVSRLLNRQHRAFSGEYYEKQGQSIKIQVNGSKVKITRTGEDKKEGFEIKTFPTSEEAVKFCLTEEEWLKGEGYKAMNHKFVYSFVNEDFDQQKKSTKTKPKSVGSTNILSITAMTDDAMSNRSRNSSSAKSDRSYASDDDDDNVYVDTKAKLGNSASDCIKVLLAETYKEDLDPTGWIMSEKLDGVRCFWTGSVMYSRNGNRFYFPKFFAKNWPKSQLDGELFVGRGKFSQTLSAVKKGVPINSEWQNVRYLVFDCPGLKKPFRERIKAMEEVLSGIDNPYIKCHAHRECKGFDDLFDELDRVNNAEGEGLMLRDPSSMYENRRSTSLLKVKTFHDDEATVLGYKQGTRSSEGLIGALHCRNSFGVEFDVGSGLNDAERRRPPKIGSKITYKYQQFNKDSGKPRFPTYVRKFDKI